MDIEAQLKSVNEEEDFFFGMQLSCSIVLPTVMKAAIELQLFDIIAKAGPGAQLSPSEIASQLPTQNPEASLMLDRIMCLLVSHSVLNCSPVTLPNGEIERRYGLEPVCKYFVNREDGGALSVFFFLSSQKAFLDSWSCLKDSVLEGGVPFDKVNGMPVFEYLGKDLECNKLFNAANFSQTTTVMKKMVEIYKGFEGLKKVVDVGGGLGTSIRCITSKYPKIKAINFDLPHVIEHAPAIPGVEHIGGDMFVSVPKGDAIFMKTILHDWSDEQCLKILKNCYKAIPEHGKVIVMEMIVPAVPKSNNAMKAFYEIDMVMMAMLPGGKERKEEDFEALGRAAGFTSMKMVCSAFNFWIMEFYKV